MSIDFSLEYRLRPGQASSSCITLTDTVLCRHLQLAGDGAFHEEALQSMAISHVLQKRGGLFFYPESAPGFIAAVKEAACKANREDDLVVLDYFGEDSTHFFEPICSRHQPELLPDYFGWLLKELGAQGGGQTSSSSWAFDHQKFAQTLASYAAIAVAYRDQTSLSDLIDILGGTPLHLRLAQALDQCNATGELLALNGLPASSADWRARVISRLSRLVKAARKSGRGKPSLPLAGLRDRVILVPMPDVLERRPEQGYSEVLGLSEVVSLLAVGLLSSVASRLYRVEEGPQPLYMVCLPEMARWCPPSAVKLVDVSRAIALALVQYTRTPLTSVETAHPRMAVEAQAFTHIGRTMDSLGRFVLVNFDFESTSAVVLPEH